MFNIPYNQEMQITMRHYFTTVRMAYIKKNWKQQMLERLWRQKNLLALLVGIQNRPTVMERCVEVPQNTEHEFTI